MTLTFGPEGLAASTPAGVLTAENSIIEMPSTILLVWLDIRTVEPLLHPPMDMPGASPPPKSTDYPLLSRWISSRVRNVLRLDTTDSLEIAVAVMPTR